MAIPTNKNGANIPPRKPDPRRQGGQQGAPRRSPASSSQSEQKNVQQGQRRQSGAPQNRTPQSSGGRGIPTQPQKRVNSPQTPQRRSAPPQTPTQPQRRSNPPQTPPSTQQTERFTNIYDEEEPFETLSVDEQIEENGNVFEDDELFIDNGLNSDDDMYIDFDDDNDSLTLEEDSYEEKLYEDNAFDDNEEYSLEETEEEPEIKTPAKTRRQVSPKLPKDVKPKVSKTRYRKTDENNQDLYADTKTGKLKPFGGKKKQKVRVDRYDSRKNRKKQATIVQFSVLGVLVLILLVGFKNAIFPPASLSEGDVAGIVAQETGMTKFPAERGKGFAIDFMNAFLTVNPSVESAHEAILGYFYTGSTDMSATIGETMNSNNGIQQVLSGPTVYQEKQNMDNSATYLIGAYVRQFKPETDASIINNPDVKGLESYDISGTTYKTFETKEKWMFFTVDVFYDPKVDGLAIAADSPTLVPNVNIVPFSTIPQPAPVGDGDYDRDLQESVKNVIVEFMKAYKQASPDNTSFLTQFVGNNPPLSLQTGLNNEVDFDGDPEDAISFDAAKSVNGNGEYRAKVVVNWKSPIAENSNISFKSTYFVSLKKVSSGYIITDISSLAYFPNQDWLNGRSNADSEVSNDDSVDDVAADDVPESE